MNASKWITVVLLTCTIASCKMKDEYPQTLNAQDRAFMTSASYGDNAEVDAGNSASTMASIIMVKNFGAMMVADHTKAQTDLVSIGTQVGVIGLPTTPDSAHVKIKTMLMMLSGRAFDSAYMKMQVADHINTITLMNTEISNGSDSRVKAYASAQLPVVTMHKRMADSIVTANGF